MEVPTYFLIGQIFRDHGIKLQALPMKNNNTILDVNRFREILEEGKMPPPKAIYIIPSNHNPTASTLPLEDRIQLIHLSHKYNILIFADEVYHLLNWNNSTKRRPARMAALANTLLSNNTTGGGVISISSFTKIFCPGIRCGWIEGPARIIDALSEYGYIRSQGGCLPFVGEVMRTALQSDNNLVDRVLLNLKQNYQERSDVLCRALLLRDDKEEDIDISFLRPTGGYFLSMKPGIDIKPVTRIVLITGSVPISIAFSVNEDMASCFVAPKL